MKFDHEISKRLVLAGVAVICLAGFAVAQPDGPRRDERWCATNRTDKSVETWVVFDDGRQKPLLFGYHISRTIRGTDIRVLCPVPFDYRSNVFRTMAVGGGKSERVEIKYLEQADERSVSALIGTNQLMFYK